MAGPLERRADRADAAVHHVRGGDDVGAGFGLDQGLVDQDRAGGVVEDIARLVDDPVMAVRRIGIERDVGEHADFGRRVLRRLDRAADQIVGIERLARIVGAQAGRRVGEQGDAGNAEVARLPRLRADPVDRPARHAGQGRDRLLDPLPLGDEQRPDQVGRASARLGDQRPAPGGGAGAAQAKGGKGSGGHVAQGLARPSACKAAKAAAGHGSSCP